MDYMYYGDTLIVDLATGKTQQVPCDQVDEVGPGLAAGLALLDEHGEDSLVMGSGLMTGTTVPSACLGFVLGTSPVTKKRAVGPLHLFAGAEVKLSGFSMIVLKGKSAEPKYLWLHDGVADVVDASGIWGKDTWETTDHIRKEMGEHLIQVVSIGPAGESKSKLASYSINYWGSGDSAGLGAVMGEKNVKAVAVRGLGMLDAEDPQAFYEGSLAMLSEAPATRGFGFIADALGAANPDGWLKPLVHRYRSCFSCPSACGTFVKYNEDPRVMEAEGVDEPGLLVASPAAAMWMMEGGWESEPACRAMEALCRAGIDLNRGSRLLAGKALKEKGEIDKAASELSGSEDPGWPKGATPKGLFGPWVPPLGEDAAWLEANRVGYVLGVCPTYLLDSGISTEGLLELCGPAAGMELSIESVTGMLP